MGKSAAFYTSDGPLAAAPALYQTRATHLEGLAELLHGKGLSPAALLEKHRIDPAVLRNPDSYIGCRPLLDTVADCSERLDAPLFGLDLALRQPQILGFVGSLCRIAPDLKTALEDLCDFLPVMHSPECRAALTIGRHVSELRCYTDSDHPGVDQLTYGAVLTLLNLCRQIADRSFRPQYVLLRPRPRGAEHDRLEREYGCKVHVGQPHTAIAFPTQALGALLPARDRIGYRLLRDYAQAVRAGQQHSLLARVQDFIRGSLADRCDLARCAAALGTNARKLQLQLEAHGVSFSDMRARQRETMARAYLASDALGLDEVAHRLGYADQTSFGRAFRRWTGKTPGAFKADGG